MQKRRLWCPFLALMLAMGIALPSAAQTPTRPVARVNGTVLTEADLQAALNEIMPAGVFHGGFSSAKRNKYRPQALEKMIEKELFYQEAVKKGLTVDEEMIAAQRQRTIRRLGGDSKFRAALKRAGLSDRQYREKLRKKFLVKRLIAEDITQRAVPTDEEIRAYYEANRSKFMRPEARRITHILISVKPEAGSQERRKRKQRAQEAIEKIRSGEDISAVAWDYSDGPYRVKGGDMGLVHRGRLDPELEKTVFALEPGKLSGIIETIYGYHIIRVEAVEPPTQLSLREVSDKLRKELSRKKEKQLRAALVARLKKTAQIVVY